MGKKEYLLALLEKLKTNWKSAPGLIMILQQQEVSDAFLDTIVDMLKKQIHDITLSDMKDTFERSIEYIEKLKEKEIEEQETDQELDNLLDTI